MFLAYAMWRLVKADANVCIVMELRGGLRYLFGPGSQVHTGTSNNVAFGDRLQQTAVRYLIDSNEPVPVNRAARALEASSLRREFYSQFEKHALALSMPTWSFAELRNCRALLRPSMPLTELRQRFAVGGGSLRLMDESVDILEQQCRQALNRYEARALITTPGHSGKQEGVPDRLLHLTVADDGTFRQTSFQFASPSAHIQLDAALSP
jgi:hypothetical protein